MKDGKKLFVNVPKRLEIEKWGKNRNHSPLRINVKIVNPNKSCFMLLVRIPRVFFILFCLNILSVQLIIICRLHVCFLSFDTWSIQQHNTHYIHCVIRQTHFNSILTVTNFTLCYGFNYLLISDRSSSRFSVVASLIKWDLLIFHVASRYLKWMRRRYQSLVRNVSCFSSITKFLHSLLLNAHHQHLEECEETQQQTNGDLCRSLKMEK